MRIYLQCRWLLVFLLLVSTCLLVAGKGGRGGGSRGGGSRGSGSRNRGTSRSRPTYRPASRPSPRPVYRPSPAPAPAPKPTQRPQPPAPKPSPPPPKPSAPEEPVVARQPASNPNFKENSQAQGSAAGAQPAYNPNYKPEGGAPGGPPPPYSAAGHPAPNAPAGPPPPYQPSGQAPPYGSAGQRPPYPQQPPGYPAQPPPYSGGPPGRPPAYPGQAGSAPYPVQPGSQPYPQQPGANRPYPVQPGSQPYPQQPRPYPVQPGGSYPQQPGGVNRPYPVQPGGMYNAPMGGRPGMPSPPYMNYGGIPTGANMQSAPLKKKGFLGSLMSSGPGRNKHNKYAGMAGMAGVGGVAGYAAGRGMGGGFGGGFGRSAAMGAILPIMAIGAAATLFRPRYMFMPMYSPMPYYHHHHYGSGSYSQNAHYYDVYSDDYVGRCVKPIKNEHTEIICKATREDIKCDAKCEDGFEFPENITLISNRCWHATGVWRPKKNFPACKPICDDECLNGGECIRPSVCKCPAEYRGDRCQFHFLNCDVRKLTKGQKNVGWVCNHFRNETVCSIRCKPPAVFESPSVEVYKCVPEGVWTPESLPRCILKKDGNSTAVE